MSTWLILAQVFGVLTIIFEFATYQIKIKHKFFLAAGVSSLFWTLMFVSMALGTVDGFATQTSLIVAAAYSTIRAIVFWWIFRKDSPKRKKAGKIFLYFMIAVALVAGIASIINTDPQVRWLHTLGFLAALVFVVCQYLPSKHYVRIAVIFYAIIVFLTQTPINILEGDAVTGLRWNFMGMAIEATKILSVFVFYFFMLKRQVLVKKLKQIKSVLNYECHKVKRGATVGEIAELMSPTQLEKLVAKMVKYEFATTDPSEIKDVKSSEERAAAVMEDMKTIQDVKAMIEKVIELKKIRLDSKPVPKLAKFQESMQEVILGKSTEVKENIKETN